MKTESKITKDALNAELEKSRLRIVKEENAKNLFTIKSANDWIEDAKNRPIPKMLFSEFWYENEICILFADTNLGKSILAVQIADSISKGKAIRGFKLESEKQPVLYFDFELSDKQFEVRYSENYKDHYRFDENLIRVEINPDNDTPTDIPFEEYLSLSVEKAIVENRAKILIVDNITYLKNETERAKDALPLMKQLKALKTKYGLSLLVLAHTPKRDASKPLSRNDIQGSKMLVNFTDSSFAIGESSKSKQLRYLKQIKQRNTEQIFDAENVVVCTIEKKFNFLEFQFLDYGEEMEHLRFITDEEKIQLESNIIQMKTENPGMSLGNIAEGLETNKMKVKRVLKKAGLV